MDNNSKLGLCAELLFIFELTKRGIQAYTPVYPWNDCDLVVEFNNRLIKVQVKSSSKNTIDLRSESGGLGHSCEFVACYLHTEGSWFIVPREEIGDRSISLKTDKYDKFLDNWEFKSSL